MKVHAAAVGAGVALLFCLLVAVRAEGNSVEDQEELAEWQQDLPTLVREERAAKSDRKADKAKKVKGDNCKYVKGAWSECDSKTNMRTRTMTLKKGDQNSCEPTKTIQKKCKKGKQSCQYEKGAWGACTANNQMTRTDRVKAGSDSSCQPTRQITRPCKPNKQAGAGSNKQNKGGSNGSGRRNRQ